MNLSVKRLEPHIRNGMALVDTTKRLRDEILINGAEGLAGLIYSIMMRGIDSEIDIAIEVQSLLGGEFMDEIIDVLNDFSDEGPRSTAWIKFGGDDPSYKLVI